VRAAEKPVPPDILAQRIRDLIGRTPTADELEALRVAAVTPPPEKPEIELTDADYTIAGTYPSLSHQDMLDWYRSGRLSEGSKQLIRQRAIESAVSNRKIEALIAIRKSLLFDDDPQIRQMQRLLGPLVGRELLSKQETRDILDDFFRTRQTRKLEDDVERAKREIGRVSTGTPDERAKASLDLDKALAKLATHVEGEDPAYAKYREEVNKTLEPLRPLWAEVQEALRTGDPAHVIPDLAKKHPGLSAADLWDLYKNEVAKFLAMTRPTWEDIREALQYGDPDKLIPELKKRHPHLSNRELWSIIKSPQALGAVV